MCLRRCCQAMRAPKKLNPDAVFFKIVDTVSVFKRRLSLPQAFPDSVSLAQRARNF